MEGTQACAGACIRSMSKPSQMNVGNSSKTSSNQIPMPQARAEMYADEDSWTDGWTLYSSSRCQRTCCISRGVGTAASRWSISISHEEEGSESEKDIATEFGSQIWKVRPCLTFWQDIKKEPEAGGEVGEGDKHGLPQVRTAVESGFVSTYGGDLILLTRSCSARWLKGPANNLYFPYPNKSIWDEVTLQLT